MREIRDRIYEQLSRLQVQIENGEIEDEELEDLEQYLFHFQEGNTNPFDQQTFNWLFLGYYIYEHVLPNIDRNPYTRSTEFDHQNASDPAAGG